MLFVKGVRTCVPIFILIQLDLTRAQSQDPKPTLPGTDHTKQKVYINRTIYDRSIESIKNQIKTTGIIPNHHIFAMDHNLNDPHWVPFSNNIRALPLDAIVGGYENETLYIIRFVHQGSLIPGKYVPSKRQAIISYNNRTFVNNEFEILCGRNYKWISTTTGNFPARAVIGGTIFNTNETQYVGRINYKGHIIPGKVIKSHNSCYVPYCDIEINSREFEVLVVPERQKPQVTGKENETVANGESANIECKIVEGFPYPTISWQFKANGHSDYVSIEESGNVLRISAADRKDAGVYKCIASNIVGRDQHFTALIVLTDPQWVPFNNTSRVVPADAIVGGYDNETLYICRFLYAGSLTPGKYVPSKHHAITTYRSRVIITNKFEILCGHNYKWIQTTTENIPAQAVVGGPTASTNEPQYVGRINYLGDIIPGKVVKTDGVCYAAYGEKEVYLQNFEILVVTERNSDIGNERIICADPASVWLKFSVSIRANQFCK